MICGHDHDYLAALAWPNVAACQRLAPEFAGLDAAALVRHPRIVAELGERLRAHLIDELYQAEPAAHVAHAR